MTKIYFKVFILSVFVFMNYQLVSQVKTNDNVKNCSLHILGTVQDGGSPHAGCTKNCCANLFDQPDPSRKVVSLGIIDENNDMNWLMEATPDLPEQMKSLKRLSKSELKETPDGILLTHAHIGHYTGLMYLGKESMNSNMVKVYAMDRMASFLRNNGPWNQLIKMKNINLIPLSNDSITKLSSNIAIEPIVVPHRDEYSETVGFIISGPTKKVLFIPDIDKWSIWDRDIVEMIKRVDLAFLDATFYDGTETPNREMSEIPHPYVVESMALFKNLSVKEKSKVHFIHMNHTNPILNENSEAYKTVMSKGFNVAKTGMSFTL